MCIRYQVSFAVRVPSILAVLFVKIYAELLEASRDEPSSTLGQSPIFESRRIEMLGILMPDLLMNAGRAVNDPEMIPVLFSTALFTESESAAGVICEDEGFCLTCRLCYSLLRK